MAVNFGKALRAVPGGVHLRLAFRKEWVYGSPTVFARVTVNRGPVR